MLVDFAHQSRCDLTLSCTYVQSTHSEWQLYRHFTALFGLLVTWTTFSSIIIYIKHYSINNVWQTSKGQTISIAIHIVKFKDQTTKIKDHISRAWSGPAGCRGTRQGARCSAGVARLLGCRRCPPERPKIRDQHRREFSILVDSRIHQTLIEQSLSVCWSIETHPLLAIAHYEDLQISQWSAIEISRCPIARDQRSTSEGNWGLSVTLHNTTFCHCKASKFLNLKNRWNTFDARYNPFTFKFLTAHEITKELLLLKIKDQLPKFKDRRSKTTHLNDDELSLLLGEQVVLALVHVEPHACEFNYQLSILYLFLFYLGRRNPTNERWTAPRQCR